MDFAPSERQERVCRELRERFGRNLPEHRKQVPLSDGELAVRPDRSFDSSLATIHKDVVGERILGLPKE